MSGQIPGDVVTDEPGPGALVEAGGVRFFCQPVGPVDHADTEPWASWPPVERNHDRCHWHSWEQVRSLGPVRLLMAPTFYVCGLNGYACDSCGIRYGGPNPNTHGCGAQVPVDLGGAS